MRFLASIKRRGKNVLISVDQLVYVMLTLGNGNPDETLSSAAWRLEHQGKFFGIVFRPVIDFIAWPFEANHCHKAYLAEHRNKCPRRLQCPLDKCD